jgi:hypothetical protein
MNLQENIYRIKEVMGINESLKKCLPKSYRPGDKYGRDELAKMFVCYTGDPKKFPVIAVKEWLFPKLPGGGFIDQDPMKLNYGQPYTFTLEQMAKVENRDTRNITIGIKTLDITQFPEQTQRWFNLKKNAPNFEERFKYQIDMIRENDYDTTIVTPKDEPIVFESVDKKLYLQEGWHRTMAILELLDNGEITPDQAKVYAVTVYRGPDYKMNIVEKPPGLFENIRNYE